MPPKKQILKDISLSFFPGAKIGVLGLNGAGKSTLLRIMAGVNKEFEGEARPMPGINVGYLPQEPQLDDEKNVRDTVEEALGAIKEAQEKLDAVYAAYAEPDADFDALASEQARLENIIEAADAHNLERKLEVAAEALRLPPWDAKVGNLSGGERRRVALCRLLLSSPDMLLLDEPTNHLDAESVAWLERFLHDYNGTVVAITHDRYFLDNVAGWILELDRGQGIPFEGNYSQWLSKRAPPNPRSQAGSISGKKPSSKSLSGCVVTLKVVRPKAKRALTALKRCSPATSRNAMKPTRSISRLARAWVIRSSSFIMSPSALKTSCCMKTFPSLFPRVRLLASSAETVRVNRPCLNSSPVKSSQTRVKWAIGDTVEIAYVEQLRDRA